MIHPIIAAALGMVVIALVVSVFIPTQAPPKTTNGTEDPFVTTSKSAQKDAYAHDYGKSIEKLTALLDSSTDKHDKFKTMVQIAAVYMNENNPQEALVWFQKAEALNGQPNISSSIGIGMAYERLGNKPEAVKAFQLAVDLMKDDPNAAKLSNQIEYYESHIKELSS